MVRKFNWYNSPIPQTTGWFQQTRVQAVVALSVPTAPLNFVAVDTIGLISFNWDSPNSNGGSPITAYNIYYGLQTLLGGGDATSFALCQSVAPHGTGPQSSSIGDGILLPGQMYEFKITAVNANGEGPPSNISSTQSGGGIEG